MSVRRLKDMFLEEGLKELNSKGILDFSLRRISANLDVSCAAPYKYFENKEAFVSEIVVYAKERCAKKLEKIVSSTRSTEEKALGILKDYLAFLTLNPYIRSVLIGRDPSLDTIMTPSVKELFEEYRIKRNLSKKEMDIKLFSVFSIIYGTSIMIDLTDPDLRDQVSLKAITLLTDELAK